MIRALYVVGLGDVMLLDQIDCTRNEMTTIYRISTLFQNRYDQVCPYQIRASIVHRLSEAARPKKSRPARMPCTHFNHGYY